MAVTTVCVAPSEALAFAYRDRSSLGTANRLFGELAERLIELDYLAQRPGTIFADHYFDNPEPASYIAFLVAHNRRLQTPARIAQLAILSLMADAGIARPDILTHQASVRDLYEIKPDSTDGSYAGAIKLLRIEAFMGMFGLPYVNGTTYRPTPRSLIASGTIATVSGTVPYRLYFAVRLSLPGLIQYKVCVETDFAAIAATVLAIIAAIIVALLLRGARGVNEPVRIPLGTPPVIA